ncbi:MAG TPA: aldo/keto reductase [Tepidisphaeraceae bacterium]|nr:aldo/keto reductase [Tepidisphaeraceae bacterium]
MVQRPLGKTGLTVSPLAFGAFKIGRNQKIKYAASYELPTDTEVDRLLNGVLDLGINLIDTAPAYGLSEERVGQTIAHRRRDYILSTKVGETFENGHSVYDFSKAAITYSIHRSLKRLRTEILDLVFIHSDGTDLEILRRSDAVPTLQLLRSQGYIRFLGLSGKTVEGAEAAMDWADLLMVEYHPQDITHQTVINRAIEKGLGVLVKKPLASGRIPPEQALPFILKQPVSSVVIGGLNLDHIRQNIHHCQAVNH